jgi:RNA polymerase sigma-70 factor (ECF subfamily)
MVRQLLELIRPEFEPATWKAFQGLVVDGRRGADVSAELHLSINAVRIAKSRVLRRLRQEVESLIASG